MAKDSNKSKGPTEKVAKSKSANKKLKKKPSKIKRFFKYFFLTILIIGLLVGVVGVGYVVAVIKTTPPLDVNAIYNLNQPSMLFDDQGEFIDDLPSTEIRYIIPYEEMPQNLVNAYISIEDERFMSHGGIDVKRILGAAARDVMVILGKQSGIHGASTITQQLIKNTILATEASAESTPLDRVNRKIKEIVLAVQLDKELSKEEIIRSYLNTIPLSGHIYGVEAASRYFFAKNAKDLTLLECAYIAGITQAPTTYSAYNTGATNYPNGYIRRTQTVLSKMLELGYISQADFDTAYAQAEANEFNFSKLDTDYGVNQEWFVYPALEQVKSDLKEKYKYTDDEVNKLLVNGGLKIYTTLNTEMQNSVQSILDERTNLQVDDTSSDPTDNDGVPKLQASATVIDYKTGQVKVLIGGRGKQPPTSINRAYFDLKSIGSTTKPLTIYGPAIDTKLITAGTPLDDTSVSSEIIKKYNFGNVNPRNANGSMAGFVTAREALTYSKNLTSIKTVDMLGLDTAIEYGERAGLKYAPESHTMSALALGQFEQPQGNRDGGNTTILASAYGALGNNGVIYEPSLYTKVEDASGNILLEKEAKPTTLFSPQTAFILYDILKGSSSKAEFNDIPVAGKTGTTDNSDNFWFAGVTPYYSGSVWIGYDIPQKMNGSSGSAASLFGKVMSVIHSGLGYTDIEAPSGLVQAKVCKDSGKSPTDLCYQDQRGNRVKTEYFIEGTEPKSVCDVHVMVTVNSSNNKLANDNTPARLRANKVFIKKSNANPNADDYPFVVPTAEDDTKPEEKISLSQIGLRSNMDLYDAIVILNNRGIKYSFNGLSVSGSINPGQYTLTSFTSEINTGETVVLTIKVTTNTPDEDIGATPTPGETPDENEDNDEQRSTLTNMLNNLLN
ncbi:MULTISPECIES: transglycosylase domain-containing protein [unclassified Clostridium]|uniref:transglycosylase domain-containing protein n=1 Tax=unclassified Clostridium TaxID=2614128 RepID=UPI001C8C0A9E|nr:MULTISPECIES: transglycosylase domain-containing protein [unclassified Clostridium]MBX9136759.1 peptidase [Clostridium sp. K12(2020)]MBX9145184.1 peptidase [Clostridium sp. K13]